VIRPRPASPENANAYCGDSDELKPMQPPKPIDIDNVFAMSEPQHMLSKLLPREWGPPLIGFVLATKAVFARFESEGFPNG
jgi:hypothetical protein